MSQFDTGSSETSFDGTLRHASFGGDLADVLALEVERFEELDLRAAQPRQSPAHERRGIGCIR